MVAFIHDATGSPGYILLWWQYIPLVATQPQLHVWLRGLFKRECTNLANEFHMNPGISGSFPPCLCITTRVMHVAKSDTVEPWASMQKRTV